VVAPQGQPIFNLIWPSAFVMDRLRKPKLPIDDSVLPLTSPAELVQNLAAQGGVKALAASSFALAIAHSIGSPSHDIGSPPHDISSPPHDIGSPSHGTSSDRGATRKMNPMWQTAYAAAREAVETADESFDMFRPLAAVLFAMSMLVNHDDVSAPRS
jgi:hypothetical protein